MGNDPINRLDPWGASEKSGGKSKGSDGGSSTSSSSGNSSSPSGGKSGGISPKSINKNPDKFKEGERLFSGPFETDLMFHGGLFYHEQKYRSLVQDLVDSYGDGKAFDEKLSTFANENGFSENFIEIYAEQGRETYGSNEIIGDLGLKNPFINFGLESNDFDVIAIASVFGLAKNGIKYFLSRATGRGIVNAGTKIGWKVGEPITNLTSKGRVPSWSALRQRFWKNEALLNSGSYNSTNLIRMRSGLAPQRINPITGKLESMELHHIIPQRDGGLFEFIKVWPDEHRLIDPFRR